MHTLMTLCIVLAAAEMPPRDYAFDGSISREVLENYLSRAVTMMDLLTGKGDVDDNLRMLRETGAKFAGRTVYLWGGEQGLEARLESAREIAPRVHAMDPELILQAGIFEIVTTQVASQAVPAWVFEEFGLPVEERSFNYEAMLFRDGKFVNHWGDGSSVPDMSQLETRMWFYYLARRYIDAGCEAIHFGQVALIGAADPDHAHWWDMLSRVRRYAQGHARRNFVLCDAHTPHGGPRYDGDKLLFDFHSFPLRIKEVEDAPLKGVLEVGYLDSIYGRSNGGITPSGWACSHLPYLVELDNWGSSGKEGQYSGSHWCWGYDEIDWFAHQSPEYRAEWLRYAWDWVREHDPNGFLQMPGSRCLHTAVPLEGGGETWWYHANRRSESVPAGFGDEETVREIWQRDAEPRTGCEIRVDVDFGEDLGQNFGTLFETRTRDGAYVVGAGFLGLYNTYYREDRHAVQFFVRPVSGDRELHRERLPRPGELAGTYLFSHDGTLHAVCEEVRVWDPAEQRWDTAPEQQPGRMRLGNGVLTYDRNSLAYDGQQILGAPEQGDYYGFYYAQGRLFFYHTFKAGRDEYRPYASDAEGFSRLYACPWRPGDGAIDFARGAALTLPFVGETPFSWGQLRNDALTCSNIGGVYVFDGSQWRTVVDGELETSYQVYSMLNVEDRLLLGQYPTGELFEFNGEAVTQLAGQPPRMDGVSGSSREAQTLAIYGGEVYAGVWPWGELWRYQPDTKAWTFAGRMFEQPAPTDATTHPYENECAALGGVANLWGQRVTSLVPLGASLYVGTSAKGPWKWEPKYDFLDGDRWKEYGTVHRLTVPGHISAPTAWTGKPTQLRFILDSRGMRVVQEGRVIGEAEFAGTLPGAAGSAATLSDLTWGRGIYGTFNGSALSGAVKDLEAGAL